MGVLCYYSIILCRLLVTHQGASLSQPTCLPVVSRSAIAALSQTSLSIRSSSVFNYSAVLMKFPLLSPRFMTHNDTTQGMKLASSCRCQSTSTNNDLTVRGLASICQTRYRRYTPTATPTPPGGTYSGSAHFLTAGKSCIGGGESPCPMLNLRNVMSYHYHLFLSSCH